MKILGTNFSEISTFIVVLSLGKKQFIDKLIQNLFKPNSCSTIILEGYETFIRTTDALKAKQDPIALLSELENVSRRRFFVWVTNF